MSSLSCVEPALDTLTYHWPSGRPKVTLSHMSIRMTFISSDLPKKLPIPFDSPIPVRQPSSTDSAIGFTRKRSLPRAPPFGGPLDRLA